MKKTVKTFFFFFISLAFPNFYLDLAKGYFMVFINRPINNALLRKIV